MVGLLFDGHRCLIRRVRGVRGGVGIGPPAYGGGVTCSGGMGVPWAGDGMAVPCAGVAAAGCWTGGAGAQGPGSP